MSRMTYAQACASKFIVCPSCKRRLYEIIAELTPDKQLSPKDVKPASPDVPPPTYAANMNCPLCFYPWFEDPQHLRPAVWE